MKIAFIFPGYGSQYIGMGQKFFYEYPIVQKRFKQASEHTGIDFTDLCFSPSESELVDMFFSSKKELNEIKKAYLSIFLVSSSICDVLKEHGVKPSVAAGYDTGQYAALYAAQGISFLQGIDILQEYADIYKALLKAYNYDIIKITGLTETKLPQFLDDNRTFIAAHLSRTAFLVSGTKDGIRNLREKLLGNSGVSVSDEGVGIGLNAEFMSRIVKKIIPFLATIKTSDVSIPVISNVDGKEVTGIDAIKEDIIGLISKTIRWDKVMDSLENSDFIIGVGTQPSLLNLIQDKYPKTPVVAVRTLDDIYTLRDVYGLF